MHSVKPAAKKSDRSGGGVIEQNKYEEEMIRKGLPGVKKGEGNAVCAMLAAGCFLSLVDVGIGLSFILMMNETDANCLIYREPANFYLHSMCIYFFLH